LTQSKARAADSEKGKQLLASQLDLISLTFSTVRDAGVTCHLYRWGCTCSLLFEDQIEQLPVRERFSARQGRITNSALLPPLIP
jgi:hypothetical protein